MILVVDSGSTKADWRLVLPNGAHVSYSGRGINPLHVLPDEILKTVQERMPAELHRQPVKRLFFYGAGCGASTATPILSSAFSDIFSGAAVEVLPDFLGAARALFGCSRGVVGILGTGSACGLYDGAAMVSTSNSLGYVLGDEGSATDLGKRLLRAFFYNRLPAPLSQLLSAQGVTREKVLQSVYHSDAPAVYLSSFLPFLIEHRTEEAVEALVKDSFSDFFTHHVRKIYSDGFQLGIVGSVGFIFSDIFREVAKKHGVENLELLQYPIARLAEFHILHP